MSEIERLARIAHSHIMPEEPWEDCPGMHWHHEQMIQAIITALSTPDDATIEAAARAFFEKTQERFRLKAGWDILTEAYNVDEHTKGVYRSATRAAIHALCSHIGGSND